MSARASIILRKWNLLSQGETRACCWLPPPILNNKRELNLPGARRNYIRREWERGAARTINTRACIFKLRSHSASPPQAPLQTSERLWTGCFFSLSVYVEGCINKREALALCACESKYSVAARILFPHPMLRRREIFLLARTLGAPVSIFWASRLAAICTFRQS